MDRRFESRLASTSAGFQALLARIPDPDGSTLPANWLRCEMLERLEVLRRAPLAPSGAVLEVGSGPHAIATIPLAFLAGPAGWVVAAERGRWGKFRSIVVGSGVGDRIRPVTLDAGRLPVRDHAVDLAVCVHGIRSLGGRDRTIGVIREMLRAAPRVFLAESLPVANTPAQRAHLAMYELREEAFLAAFGRRDDFRYARLEDLVSLAQDAGGLVDSAESLEIDLPHFLARFPRSTIESIPPGPLRDRLLRRWDDADALLRRHGEDHPPVGIVVARRA